MLRRLLTCQRGSTNLIELAILGAPLMLGLVFGSLQWKMNNSAITALELASREAGRYYAIYRDDVGARAKADQIIRASLAVTPARFDPASDVVITLLPDNYVRVKTTYHQPNFVPGLPRLFGLTGEDPSTWTFSASAIFRMEGP